MRLKGHLLASGAVSAGIYAATGSAKMAACSFAAGVLLDADHLIDYWRDHSFNLDLSRFFSVCHECDLSKTMLPLHSVELLLLLAAAACFTRSGAITALALGSGQHLFFDQLVNKVYPYSYSFFYRMGKGFRSDAVFTNVRPGAGKNGND